MPEPGLGRLLSNRDMRLKSARPYLFATLFVLVTFAFRLSLDPWLGDRSPLLPFTVAIVVATGLYGVAPGILAMFLGLALAIPGFMLSGDGVGLSLDQYLNIALFLIASAAMLVFAGNLRRARLKAERLQLELQFRQAVNAMGTMAATLAHELNQPLAASVNYLAACKQMAARIEDVKAEPLRKGLDEAEAQIQRAGAIIRHARGLVSNAPAQRAKASVNRMIERVLEIAAAGGLSENLAVRMDIDAAADRVFVNAVQIEQVLLNVVRNAVEASSAASRTPELAFSATVANGWSQIEIRDNGPGIPEERMANLFSASGGSTGGGLGLGLSISRTIVESHGGNIWAVNGPDGGASILLTLPRLESGA